jgi:hypothetical protein
MVISKRLIAIVAVVAFFANVACAAMFHGTKQQITLRSNDPDAELFVNEASVGKGNAVAVFKKNQNYVITVKKEGCEPFSIPAVKSFDPVTLLGVLIDFGVISILVVDGAATGAWSQFDQTAYVIDPKCATVTPAAEDSTT